MFLNPWVPFWRVPATALAGTLAVIRLAPEYSVLSSYWATFSALFSVLAIAYLFWGAILYPKLFSPLRHLPTAPVRFPTSVDRQGLLGLTTSPR